jgi:membrane-associated phospholipid phosphatase
MTERNVMSLTRWIAGSFSGEGHRTKPDFLMKISQFLHRTVFDRCVEVSGPQIPSKTALGFHLRMAFGTLTVLLISLLGCKLTSIHSDISGRAIAIVAMFAMVSPLPIYWHEKGRTGLREAALVIPWELLLAAMISFPVLIAARLGMPLEDSLFGRIDQSLGVSVPAIVAWADHHWLGAVINSSYSRLIPLLGVAALAPALLGQMRHAREFLLANLIAFAIGLPLFALLPAAGPWYYYHLTPNPAQAACWAQLLSLRLPGPYLFQNQAAGIVCFPSFHVIWAILCAAALWGFRPVRIPIALLSGLIIASTLTTGWHYFSDVLAGIVISILSIVIAKVYAA